jgi:uncharacterized repeat protein (TIGR02059 family)
MCLVNDTVTFVKKLSMRRVLIVLFLLFSTIVRATNYYVSSSSGDDTKDGLSEANAWKTISKVNGRTFSPGDAILFKKGDIWREILKVPSNGNAGSYLVFSVYGTGDSPRIVGSTQAMTWTNQGGNIWRSATSVSNPYGGSYPSEIFFENTNNSVSWGVHKANTGSLTAEYNWTWATNNIYVYSATDPGTRYKSVEVPQRDFCIDLNDKNYLQFNGIDVFYPLLAGYTYHTWPMQSQTGLIIENSEVGYISIKDSEYAYGIDAAYSDMIVRHCDIHDCGRRAISFHIYGKYTARNILVEDNYFHDGWHTTGPDFSVGSSASSYTSSIDGAIVRRNVFYDPPTSTSSAHQIFIQNYLWSSLASRIDNLYIYSNIFISPCGAAINMEGSQSVYIYNNTFYNNNNRGSIHVWIDNNNSSVKIKNNIFYTLLNFETGGTGAGLFIRSGQDYTKVDADYNLYYRINNSLRIIDKEAGSARYFMNDIARIRSELGYEIHSPTPANPMFVSSTDYHVQQGSPAIGAGVAIPEVTTDLEGNAFTNPPNIGCYATPLLTNNPVYLSSVIENATPSLLTMTYNKTLANVVPATSAFTVTVNSVARSVNSVSISGTKVLLTLAAPVVYGDVITVSYTKPAQNPLQIASGEEASSISSKPVTNNIINTIPVYVSSVIANATPTLLEMTYSLSLANVVPAASAFTVRVNSVNRTVSSVAIVSGKVRLTLASPVVYGDVVTVAYTKPASNPLQSTAGGQAVSISAQNVTNNVSSGTPVIPVYVSSVIANATPTILEMTYSVSLANVVPAASAFTVRVNSVNRTVSSVAIVSGKVRLTLSSPVIYGNIVTVAYTKPGSNPLQSSTGGQAASITAQPVTNNVSPVLPVYVNSVIANATPTILDMTYSISLANVVPATSAFSVSVNSVNRTVSSVTIVSGKVRLTLSSPVAGGDVVTVAYTKPASNPLQTASGAQAASIGAQPVTNNVGVANSPPVIVVNYKQDNYSGFIAEINASASYDVNLDNLTYEWTVPSNMEVSSTTASRIQYLAPLVKKSETFEFILEVSDGKSIQSKTISVNILPYKPGFSASKIKDISASDFDGENYPENIIDNDLETLWSSNGDGQWLSLELKKPFEAKYFEVAFQKGQRRVSYFDIYGSKDNLAWYPILLNAASCNFAGGFQIFDVPEAIANSNYSFIRLVGQGNSVDSWNNFSEFRIFGRPPITEIQMIIYPNPAREIINIALDFPADYSEDDAIISSPVIRIFSTSGILVFEKLFEEGTYNIEIPINFESGLYIVQMVSDDLIIAAQKLVVTK